MGQHLSLLLPKEECNQSGQCVMWPRRDRTTIIVIASLVEEAQSCSLVNRVAPSSSGCEWIGPLVIGANDRGVQLSCRATR